MKIPSYKIDEYIKNIDKQKISGCLVFGPESSLIDFYSKQIALKIVPNISDPFLVANISKENMGENSTIILDEFFSLPMLGGRKIIWVNDSGVGVTHAIKSLINNDNFSNKSDNFILIQGRDLEKSNSLRKIFETNPNFAAIACFEEGDALIKKFIGDLLRQNNIKFSNDIIDFIFEKIGKKRDLIKNEIKKIVLFLGDEKELNLEKLEHLIVSQSESSANDFVQNFANKKYGTALFQAQKLINEGFSSIALIRFLTNYFSKLYSAKSDIENCNIDFESAVKKQRLFFKIEADFKRQLNNSSINNISYILSALQNLELSVKQGGLSGEFIFYKFLQKISKIC